MRRVLCFAVAAIICALVCDTAAKSVPDRPRDNDADGTCSFVSWHFFDENKEFVLNGTGDVPSSCNGYRTYKNFVKILTINEGLTAIGNNVFSGWNNLISVTIPSTVTSIGIGAFSSCGNLSSVTFSEGLLSIGNRSFQYCDSLEVLNIPSTVNWIGGAAFEGCTHLKEIIVNSTNPTYISIDGVVFTKNMTSLIQFPPAKDVISYDIPDNVTIIESYAFKNSTKLISIHLPANLELIRPNAFESCISLKSIEFPPTLKTIESTAFSCCSNLTSLNIPESVESIGNFAFSQCTNLESVNYFGKFDPCGSYGYIFYEDTHLNNVRVMYDYMNTTFCGLNNLQNVFHRIRMSGINEETWYITHGNTISNGTVYPNVNNLKDIITEYHVFYNDSTRVTTFTETTEVNNDISLLLCCEVTIEGIVSEVWYVMCGEPLVSGVISGDISLLNKILNSSHLIDRDNAEVFTENSTVDNDITLVVSRKITIEGIDNTTWYVVNGSSLGSGVVSGNTTLLKEILEPSDSYIVGNKRNHEIVSSDTIVLQDIEFIIMNRNTVIIELESHDELISSEDIAVEISALTGIDVDHIIVTILRDEDDRVIVKVYVPDDNSARLTTSSICSLAERCGSQITCF